MLFDSTFLAMMELETAQTRAREHRHTSSGYTQGYFLGTQKIGIPTYRLDVFMTTFWLR